MMIKLRKELERIYKITDNRIKFKLFIEIEINNPILDVYLIDENAVYTRDYLDKINEMLKVDAEQEQTKYVPVTLDKIKLSLERAIQKEFKNKNAYIKFIDKHVIKICML